MASEGSSLRARASAASTKPDDAVTDADDPQKPAKRSFALRCLFAVFPTPYLIPIWGLIALNWVMHMVLRDIWWGVPVIACGHFFLVMTIISFAQACNTPPGSPPPSSNYKSNDLPPRAYFLQREQTIILGFDHYCWWLGAPIGWYNRKFFLQFVIYASSLAGYSFVFITMDTFRLLPGAFGGDPPDHIHRRYAEANAQFMQMQHPHMGMGTVNIGPFPANLMYLALAIEALNGRQMLYCGLMLVVGAANLVAFGLLGGFAAWHVYMVLKNQTTLHPPGEENYDLGALTNWKQVFGQAPWLWMLPVWGGDAPHGDGLSWPRRNKDAAPGV